MFNIQPSMLETSTVAAGPEPLNRPATRQVRDE